MEIIKKFSEDKVYGQDITCSLCGQKHMWTGQDKPDCPKCVYDKLEADNAAKWQDLRAWRRRAEDHLRKAFREMERIGNIVDCQKMLGDICVLIP